MYAIKLKYSMSKNMSDCHIFRHYFSTHSYTTIRYNSILKRIMMNKIITVLLFTLANLHAGVDMPSEDLNTKQVLQIKKFYKTYLQKSCGNTAANFAQMHTQKEWSTMQQKKGFIQEILKVCPKSDGTVARILIQEHGKENFDYLLHFSIQYAKGTGKFPPC